MLKAVLIAAAAFAPFAVAVRMPGGGEACRAAQQVKPAEPDYERELFFAVLEGLYSDAVSNEAVDAITVKDPEHGYPANFVWNCPICMPAYRAFLTYRARPHFEWIKGDQDFGPGLDTATMQRLTKGALGERQTEIMNLVERWLARRLAAQRLTEAERRLWEDEMMLRRKKGVSMLREYQQAGMKGSYAQMKDCPFCDGANKPFAKKQ